MEKNIETNIVEGNYIEDFLFDGNEIVVEIYKKNITKIRELSLTRKSLIIQEDLNKILENPKWGEKLYKYCEKNEHDFMNKKGFIKFLNIQKIKENIEKTETLQIYNFQYALQHIYSFSNLSDYYKQDKDSLEKLNKLLAEIKVKDKVKIHSIRKVINLIDRTIKKLEI